MAATDHVLSEVRTLAEARIPGGMTFGVDKRQRTIYIYTQRRVSATLEETLKEQVSKHGYRVVLRYVGRFHPA